nr:N-acetylmuramoyl-L-alanine amidase [uncultured Fretibacterium sp.]
MRDLDLFRSGKCFSSLGLLGFVLAVCLMLSGPAWGSATLYRGGNALGSVPTTNGSNNEPWVSLTDTGALLGFQASLSGEELLLVRGDIRFRIVLNAVAAWRDLYLIPLYGAAFERDGRWWLDIPSVLSLFQRATGTGAGNRLRFEVEADAPPSEPAGSEALPTADASVPSPSEPVGEGTPQAGGKEAKGAERVEGATIPIPAGEKSLGESPAKDKPDAKPEASGNRGEIRALRWSTSRERIRAVIDCSDGAEPQIQVEKGNVRALFSSASEFLEGLPSPYGNISADLKRGPSGASLVFSSNSLRVERLALDAPRRIVLDFFFESPADIRVLPAPTPPPAPAPAPAPVPGPAGKSPRAKTPVQPPARRGGKRLVVVDPGHGGKDPGATANGVREKDINLGIGLALEEVLRSRGFEVQMTRRTDVYLKLQERTDIANQANADVFVSVHANALPSLKNTAGFEIYLMALPTDKDALALAKIENREYVEEKSGSSAAVDRRTELLLRILGDMQQNNKISESTELAEALFKAGKLRGIPMKRVAQAPFFVLRGAGMPAVLLETGFVTNLNEAKLLAHPGYQRRIAEAMAEGIVNYLN